MFGGTGFLGRRIVRKLVADGWRVRIAVRHPEAQDGDAEIPKNPVALQADIRDEEAVARAVDGASTVVNAVSLYREDATNEATFRSIHEESAGRVALLSKTVGAARVLHISGIGADAASTSRFIRSRGRGEQNVFDAFPDATVVRPSAMFGEGDGFFNNMAGIVRRSPVFPLIGGDTRLQPVDADDVAKSIAALADSEAGKGETLEFGGPDIATMREIVEWLFSRLRRRRLILPIPLPIALAQARCLELLPSPPLTVSQVELLRKDNVVTGLSGFDIAGTSPASSYKETVPGYIRP